MELAHGVPNGKVLVTNLKKFSADLLTDLLLYNKCHTFTTTACSYTFG